MQSFNSLNRFVLIIGNARSGSTILGSIIDAHPKAIVANESSASTIFWRGLNRNQILNEIKQNSDQNRLKGRFSEGYDYSIHQQNNSNQISVIGDKVWNPATLLLHGDHALLNALESLIGAPIKIIHAMRNPFDVIATMHQRSKAPISDRILWYFMHCDAIKAISNQLSESYFLNVSHEDLINSPETTIKNVCHLLDLKPNAQHIKSCQNLLFSEAKQTRFNVKWTKNDFKHILNKMPEYDFLKPYLSDDYSKLIP